MITGEGSFQAQSPLPGVGTSRGCRMSGREVGVASEPKPGEAEGQPAHGWDLTAEQWGSRAGVSQETKDC